MLLESLPFGEALSSGQVMVLWIVGMGISVPIVGAVVGIIAGAWTKIHQLRLETALKQQMLERGMSAEEIVQVMRSRRDRGSQRDRKVVDYPCASEVVVEHDDEWSPSLILRREGERYLVHYVGTDMSENEWVTSDRVRFPAGAEDPCGSPGDWAASAGAFDASRWCANKSKPAPMNAEL